MYFCNILVIAVSMNILNTVVIIIMCTRIASGLLKEMSRAVEIGVLPEKGSTNGWQRS